MFPLLVCSLTLSIFQAVNSQQIHFTNERIVGGHDIEIEDLPYQIGLIRWGVLNCGGSIISETWIVTAAHCVMWLRPDENIYIQAGSSYQISDVVIKAKNVILHPEYHDFIYNDIALVELEKHLMFGPTIQPIALPKYLEEFSEGDLATISGWGSTEFNGTMPLKLQSTLVPLVSHQYCQKVYDDRLISQEMICAGYIDGGHDACGGDSGGPLALNGKLIGIVSFGRGCGDPGIPGVYSKVSYLIKSIEDVTGVLKF